jgi:hypothetical protein
MIEDYEEKHQPEVDGGLTLAVTFMDCRRLAPIRFLGGRGDAHLQALGRRRRARQERSRSA